MHSLVGKHRGTRPSGEPGLSLEDNFALDIWEVPVHLNECSVKKPMSSSTALLRCRCVYLIVFMRAVCSSILFFLVWPPW